jgi:hypothetical protein
VPPQIPDSSLNLPAIRTPEYIFLFEDRATPMDHLPSCPGSNIAHPEVPLLQGYQYDGRGFGGYSERQGFDKKRLLVGDFSQHDSQITAAFLQCWLYFGVLEECLGETIRKRDFLFKNNIGHFYITTANLLRSIEARIQKLRRNRHEAAAASIAECLDEASAFASFLSGGLSGPTTCPLPPEVALSIMALGSSIDAALWHAKSLCGVKFTRKRWGCSLYLHNRMLEDGWCLNDLRRLHEHGSIPLMYYASSITRIVPPGFAIETARTRSVMQITSTTKPT